MAGNTHTSLAAWDRALDAALDVLDGGYVEIYTGPQPATPDVPVTTQTLLGTFALPATAFEPAAYGVKTANAVGSANAVAGGLASWFRAFEADGVTAVIDGSAGDASTSPDMVLNDATLTSGGIMTMSAWSITCPTGQ